MIEGMESAMGAIITIASMVALWAARMFVRGEKSKGGAHPVTHEELRAELAESRLKFRHDVRNELVNITAAISDMADKLNAMDRLSSDRAIAAEGFRGTISERVRSLEKRSTPNGKYQ